MPAASWCLSGVWLPGCVPLCVTCKPWPRRCPEPVQRGRDQTGLRGQEVWLPGSCWQLLRVSEDAVPNKCDQRRRVRQPGEGRSFANVGDFASPNGNVTSLRAFAVFPCTNARLRLPVPLRALPPVHGSARGPRSPAWWAPSGTAGLALPVAPALCMRFAIAPDRQARGGRNARVQVITVPHAPLSSCPAPRVWLTHPALLCPPNSALPTGPAWRASRGCGSSLGLGLAQSTRSIHLSPRSQVW